jgi:hypothetical protein
MSINSLCVNANRTELAPLVYETWPDAVHYNSSDWISTPIQGLFTANASNNDTVLDSIFGWKNYSLEDLDIAHTRPSKQYSILQLEVYTF